MDARAKRALRTIRDCVAAGRYLVLAHFIKRMDSRGLFWPDVQSVIDSSEAVEDMGLDKDGRPKWRLRGRATDGLELEIACVLDRDEHGNLTVFITAYWN